MKGNPVARNDRVFCLAVCTEGRTAIEWNKKMSDSAMVSISEFDSEDIGSNPTLTSGFGLAAYSLMEEYCATNTETEVRIFFSRQNM